MQPSGPQMPGGGFCLGAASGGHEHILNWAEEHGLLDLSRPYLAGLIGNLCLLKSSVAGTTGSWHVGSRILA